MSSAVLTWELHRPADWLAVTSDAAADVRGVDIPAPALERLEHDLERVRERAASEGMPARRRWAFVPDALTGVVLATMSTDVLRRGDASMQDLADSLSSAPPPVGTQIWHRDIALKRLPNGSAATGLELIQVPSDDGEQHLVERYRGILATPMPGVVIRMSLSTYDLALFDDIVAYGDDVLGAISFDVAARTS
jgi:hypothetical protein